VTDARSVAQVVDEALPVDRRLLARRRAALGARGGELRTASTVGLAPEREQVMRSAVLRALDVPELAELVTDRQPDDRHERTTRRRCCGRCSTRSTSSTSSPSRCCRVTSCSASPRPAGAPDRADRPGRELVLRLSGVADQAATALQGARPRQHRPPPGAARRADRLPNRVLFAERLEQALASGETRRCCSATSTASSR
jgi:hypothetical protein